MLPPTNVVPTRRPVRRLLDSILRVAPALALVLALGAAYQAPAASADAGSVLGWQCQNGYWWPVRAPGQILYWQPVQVPCDQPAPPPGALPNVVDGGCSVENPELCADPGNAMPGGPPPTWTPPGVPTPPCTIATGGIDGCLHHPGGSTGTPPPCTITTGGIDGCLHHPTGSTGTPPCTIATGGIDGCLHLGRGGATPTPAPGIVHPIHIPTKR